jgi:hydrogenase expression/formation protein HypD
MNSAILEEFRNRELVQGLAKKIARLAGRETCAFMEVCGTHTMSIYQCGIRSLLPDGVRLISGPGCPVCVTPVGYVDKAVAYARQPNTIIATFGDMLRVPGSSSSLMQERALGADIRSSTRPWTPWPWPGRIRKSGSYSWRRFRDHGTDHCRYHPLGRLAR